MDESTRKQLTTRLSRAEGQLAALKRMVERDEYCVDILLQISAVQGALGKIGQILLRFHIEHCVAHACACDDAEDRRRKIDELMEVFARYGGIHK